MIGKAGGPPGTTRLVVITGGPGSGKTSLVTYLGSLGYATVSEAAIQIIHELNAQLGVAGQIAWRQQHPAEFQRRVTYRQAALEAACSVAEGSLAFCDRGRPGAKAYAQLVGYKLDAQVRSLVGAQRYLRVFLLDTLSCLAERPATGRISDRARSLHIHDLLDEAYRSSGYVPCRVPELPILDRARFVLSELGEPGPENARR